MLKTTSFVAAALVACAAQADPAAYVTAGGDKVRSGFGECVRTGQWSRQGSAAECESHRHGACAGTCGHAAVVRCLRSVRRMAVRATY